MTPRELANQAREEEARVGRVLKVAEACIRLKVTQQTVRKYVKAGKLTAKRLPSGHWRITESSVAALLTELPSE